MKWSFAGVSLFNALKYLGCGLCVCAGEAVCRDRLPLRYRFTALLFPHPFLADVTKTVVSHRDSNALACREV